MKNLKVCIEVPSSKNHNTNDKLFVEVDSIENAIEAFLAPIAENYWGGSDMVHFESGFIYKDGKEVARVSYNGRVWNTVGKNPRELSTHPEIKPEEFGDFLKSLA